MNVLSCNNVNMTRQFCLNFTHITRPAFYRIATQLPARPSFARRSACDARIAMARVMRTALAFLLLLIAGRADAAELLDFEKYVRTDDGYVREVIREAMDTSPSFRALVARLMRSNVIVYVVRERGLRTLAHGQLNF